ncbi:MAG: hypothetical protein D6795_01645, partial [Deltaproteobacteria bacterium]
MGFPPRVECVDVQRTDRSFRCPTAPLDRCGSRFAFRCEWRPDPQGDPRWGPLLPFPGGRTMKTIPIWPMVVLLLLPSFAVASDRESA